MTQNGGHLRMNVIGMVCPRTGQFFAIEASHSDSAGTAGNQSTYLPYWPDLNPIERIWLTMKARGFNNDVCKNEEKLLERLDQAILDLINNPKKIQKTACIGTLL